MTTTEITKFETSHGQVELSVTSIKDLFCPLATDSEAAMFLAVCQYQGLNPFLRDAYLIKYDTKAAASIVIGKDFFTKRADSIAAYDGVRAGIVVMRKEQVVQTEGALPLPGDKLIGGWAEVTRKVHPHCCKSGHGRVQRQPIVVAQNAGNHDPQGRHRPSLERGVPEPIPGPIRRGGDDAVLQARPEGSGLRHRRDNR